MVQVLIYDYRWHADGQHTLFQASSGSRYGEKNIEIGQEISVSINASTRCGGSMRDGNWAPCPTQSMGKKKCDTCRAREGSFVFTSFDGFNTSFLEPKDLERIQGEHWVYLALFEEHLIKVGVSKDERKTLRQIEQGAHATLYIAKTPDGILARQIETTIRNSGLADKIQSSQKKESLCPEITNIKCQSLMHEKLNKHTQALDHFPQLKEYLLESPEFFTWEESYQLQTVINHSKVFHAVKLQEGESVSGVILARKGPFLFIEIPDEIVALNSKDLLGKEVEFAPTPPGLRLNQAFQSALF